MHAKVVFCKNEMALMTAPYDIIVGGGAAPCIAFDNGKRKRMHTTVSDRSRSLQRDRGDIGLTTSGRLNAECRYNPNGLRRIKPHPKREPALLSDAN